MSEQQQVHVAEIGFHRYFFWKKDDGVCDVRMKSDAERLLNPKNNMASLYEVAYEKYGFTWDENGKQVDLSPVEFTTFTNGASSEMVTIGESVVHSVNGKPKMSVMERMAKARAARKLKAVQRNGTQS